ncbi:uncharacterized protein LOC112457257 [Temnothorax curvispinosus]|uniref:Uncharacterized protein LOC112457257 n=1 Tax=Temnothorax curvispinosus TaxID=300111 RepID=A0A6J1Q4V5_9HYME|nr:uncharacterized protein LOC112457257 [Temnothorax curvispinosus]
MPLTPRDERRTFFSSDGDAASGVVVASQSIACAQDIRHESTDSLLRGLIEQIKSTDAKISAFIDSQQRTNEEISVKLSLLDRLNDTVSQNSQRIIKLEQENANLVREVRDLRSARSTQATQSGSELIVSGLPSTLSATPSEIAKNVFATLDVPNLSCHIVNTRLVKREPSSTVPTVSSPSSSVIISLASSVVRDAVLSSKRSKGAIRQSDVCGGSSHRNVYVNELLPKSTFNLMQQVKRIAKDKSYKYVWVRDGQIHVRRTDGEPVININSDTDLAKLV